MALFSNRRKLWLLLAAVFFVTPAQVQAQIVPDDTLGTESSSLMLDQALHGDTIDLIDGGALRGGNLFHSFREFNIADGQRVYFANPVDVESILSRVTGRNPSEILGTLGVDGPASLFLINPNGLIFGENARLDIEGSFYGTTADGVAVGEEVFSAVTPDQRGVLNVNPSAAFWNYLTAGNIDSRGALAAGEDLVLAGQHLDLQNQVAASGNVLLLATDTLDIRDTAEVPFIALAGEDLLVQGNQQVNIVALSHPDSGLFSYGDMVLRSAERVGGDTHYLSGGDFRVERLDGSDGELYSPIDPIVRTSGDVRIGTYRGSSLHILAGGSVTIGTAEITTPEGTNLDIDFLRETITLSDGTVVEIDGGAQPTLDVRAGIRPDAVGTPPLTLLTGFNGNTDDFSDDSVAYQIPTSADISVGDIALESANGVVLLTNQYEPNQDLPGGNILITGDGERGFGINARSLTGAGGAIYIDARSNLDVLNSSISTTTATDGQDIVLVAGEVINFIEGNRVTGAFSNLASGGTGSAGNVRITATALNVVNGAQLNSLVLGNGQGGDVIINVLETARFEGVNLTDGSTTGAFSSISREGTGTGGDVHIQARNLEVLNGAVLSASSMGIGDAGSVILVIDETARLEGSNPVADVVSGASSSVHGEGAGGDIRIQARNLEVSNGAQLSAGSFGVGDAGSVILLIDETAHFDGSNPTNGRPSSAFSSVQSNGEGTGGDVHIQARNLEVSNGALLSASSMGIGDAGSIILVIDETARFEGSNPVEGRVSGASSSVYKEGRGGDIRIQAGNLEVSNGARLSTGSFGMGDAGSIILVIDETAQFNGSDPVDGSVSGAFSSIQSDGEGTGGDIRIQAQNLEVLNGALLSASSFGVGDAGSVILLIDETAWLEDSNPVEGIVSGVSSSVQPKGEGTGGDVRIQARNLEVRNGARLSADSFGIGDAGSLILLIDETARFDGSDPTDGSPSGAFSRINRNSEGTGGDVHIQARNLEVNNGAELDASSSGIGNAGSVILVIDETARFDGSDPADDSPSGAFSSVLSEGEGTGGDVRIQARNLEVSNGALLSASSSGIGNSGSVILVIDETARFEGSDPTDGAASGAFSSIQPEGDGTGGDVHIQAQNIEVLNGALLDASSFGMGDAGSVILVIDETARFDGSDPIDNSPSGAFSNIEPSSEGTGGDVHIQARNLEVLNGAWLDASSSGIGNAGSVILVIDETARFEGSDPTDGAASGAFSSLLPGGEGAGGDVRIQARNLEVLNGALLDASSFGMGDGGSVILVIDETASFDGSDPVDGSASGAFSSVQPEGEGTGGDVHIQAQNLEVSNGALLDASSFGMGDGGSVILVIDETARFDGSDPIDGSPSGAFSNIEPSSEGTGGDVHIQARNLEVSNGALLDASSFGTGNAGNVLITIRNRLTARDGTIATNADRNAGGQIQIGARTIFLFGDSDIQTFVDSGENNGGNITIRANALVALDDSDILAFAADGRGGDVDLSETAFFGQDFQFAPPGTDPNTLDNNDRVDINATGGIASGTVSLADVSFVEDSLNELPDNLVNPETLVAGSCVARSRDTDSSFTITGSDGLREQPSNSSSTYSLESVQSIPDVMETEIAEPQGTYRLTDGRLVLGRECNAAE